MTDMRMDNFEDHFENNPRRKGHSKLVAKDGKITTERDSEAKQFSQAEVDALVAAERALFAQKVVARIDMAFSSVNWGSDATELEKQVVKKIATDVLQDILTLADSNALTEHDAALRLQEAKWIAEVYRMKGYRIPAIIAERIRELGKDS